MVVDFGMGIGDLKQAMEAPVLAVATHSHHDHIGSFAQFEHRCLHHLEQQALFTCFAWFRVSPSTVSYNQPKPRLLDYISMKL